MRKTLTIMVLLALAASFGAQIARADGVVDYVVTATLATGDPFSSTSLADPGDSITFTFSVDPALMGPGPLGLDSTGELPTTLNYTDTTTGLSFTGVAGGITFFDLAQGGLFNLDFIFGGDDFTLQLFGPAGFFDGTPPTLNTGSLPITPGGTGEDAGLGSLFGDDDTGEFAAIASGTVTATPTAAVPEPSSLMLLGSGFLMLGGFARKRLFSQSN